LAWSLEVTVQFDEWWDNLDEQELKGGV